MKKRNKRYSQVKVDADLDRELEDYDVASSDDGLNTEDRILLENARGRRRLVEEEEVLAVREASSESDSGDNEDENNFIDDDENNFIDGDENDAEKSDEDIYGEGTSSGSDSDIADKSDGLPDNKAWGSKKRNYYHTDYVDKDFSGFDDEEAAIMEEQEAKAIQQRLLEQLEDNDFTMGLLDKVDEKMKEGLKSIKTELESKIKVDFSKLSEQELKEFDDRETLGFNKVKEECKNYVEYAEKVLVPILRFPDISKINNCPALDLIKAKYFLILRFSLNVAFLLRLKARRISNLDRHPVIKRLLQISKYLKEIDATEQGGLRKQMLQIAKALEAKKLLKISNIDEKEKITGKNSKERRKKMLQLLIEKEKTEKEVEKKEKKLRFADEMENKPLETYAKELEQESDAGESEGNEDSDENMAEEGEKRAITYQMLKNKGLTPKRKKEVRNPRVRNKNKYKKAMVRRKGQVKVARKEVKKYDGEISGIRKNLSRSIKLK